MKGVETKPCPVTEGFVRLSFVYAREYKANPRNFITCFKKFRSVVSACEEIVKAYRRTGAMKEVEAMGKSFMAYAEKHGGSNYVTLDNILKIIYALTNEQTV